jgi:hypothetical protein
MDFFRPFCLLHFDRSAVRTFESGSNRLFLWSRVVLQKKWFYGFLFGINIMTKECFCAYTPGTFRFIQWRSLSDTASKCFISTPVFPEIGMQKNLSILNRCGTLSQSAALIDFAVFLSIAASFGANVSEQRLVIRWRPYEPPLTASHSMVNSVSLTNGHFLYMVRPIQVFFLAKVCCSYNRGTRSRKF